MGPCSSIVAGAPGFEPGLPEPESGALPGYATPHRDAAGYRIALAQSVRAGHDHSSSTFRIRASVVSGPRISSASNSGGPTPAPVTASRTGWNAVFRAFPDVSPNPSCTPRIAASIDA